MSAMRCPTLMGRSAELTVLRAALAAARLGRGGAVGLAGPPGIGKSRLVRETAAAARAWEIPVLVGRAVEAGASTAFRPLGEALLAGLRRTPDPDDPALDPFRPALGRLIPQWRSEQWRSEQWRSERSRPEESLVVLGEAVLRLLAALAGERGLVLVLEDLHWADPETLAVLEYLADNVAEERVLLLVTARDDPGPAIGTLRTLAQRHACNLLGLAPLTAAEVDEMATACVGGAVPDDVLAVLRRRAGGTPLLVEELLAAGADPAAVVPATVAELVAGRVDALTPSARTCVEAAAVLGARFDWRLLAAMVDTAEPDVLVALRAATRAGIVEARDGDGFRFHHALGRDAVLGSMLPPERTQWARRGLAALTATHPDLEGEGCDLAAELALRAGDTGKAASVLVEVGRRNLARGALASAEAVLGRARDLLGVAPDAPTGSLAAEADEVLAEVLASAGKTGDAVAVTMRSINRLTHAPDSDRALAEAHLRLARVHATAGEWSAADGQLGAARSAGGAGIDTARSAGGAGIVDDHLRLRVAAVAAQVALGDSRFADARRLADEALRDAERAQIADVGCEALLVLGRIARRDDLAGAEALFERAKTMAEQASLPVHAVRAVYELASGDVAESLRTDRLEEARTRAVALGDVAAVAVIDLQMSAVLNSHWLPERALHAADRCVAASRRFRLGTLPKALVLGAAAHAYLNRPDAAEAAMAEALLLAPADSHLLGEVWGVRANQALMAADDVRALGHLGRAMEAFDRRASEVTGSPAVGLWALLSVVADPALRALPAVPEPVTARWNHGLLRFADAVTLGRTGDAAGAVVAFAEADAVLRLPVEAPWHRLQARRLVAGAALADGWGEPARWAAEDLPTLEERGQDRWAAAVRGLLRRAGAVVPRRGRGDTTVPAELRARGVTSREADVLVLVAEGRANREIAERLFLSPRTVEKHVERLLAKTGLERRAQLVAYAAGALSRGTR